MTLRALAGRVRRALAGSIARPHPAPVFVLGNQKSGTTAVAALLAAATGRPATLDIFHRFDPGLLRDLLDRSLPFGAFVDRHRFCFAPEIVKEPSLTFLYQDLRASFPRARCIFVVRDPRDNLRSILNRLGLPGDLAALDERHLDALRGQPLWHMILDGRPFGTGGASYIETLANRWARAAAIHAAHEGSFALLRYEDFEADKAAAIAGLARRVGLEPKHDISAKLDVAFQPRGDRSVKWPAFFGPDNLARIERICAEGMERFHYLPSPP